MTECLGDRKLRRQLIVWYIYNYTTDLEGCVEDPDHGGGDEAPGEELQEHRHHRLPGGGPPPGPGAAHHHPSNCLLSAMVSSVRNDVSRLQTLSSVMVSNNGVFFQIMSSVSNDVSRHFLQSEVMSSVSTYVSKHLFCKQ